MKPKQAAILTIEIIAALFVLLFLYTAISKLRSVSHFEEVLSHSLGIGKYAGWLSWLVPGIEIITTIALIIPRTRYAGLIMAVILMMGFTGYIGYMLATSSNLPCTCGGVIEAMNSQQHFWFNLSYLIIGIVGLVLARKNIIMINRSSRIPV